MKKISVIALALILVIGAIGGCSEPVKNNTQGRDSVGFHNEPPQPTPVPKPKPLRLDFPDRPDCSIPTGREVGSCWNGKLVALEIDSATLTGTAIVSMWHQEYMELNGRRYNGKEIWKNESYQIKNFSMSIYRFSGSNVVGIKWYGGGVNSKIPTNTELKVFYEKLYGKEK